MGLSSSQARLLNLTARMHDIEYKAQNLEAQKLQMANESTQVYKEYEDALNKQKVQFKNIGSDGAANYVDADIQTLLKAGYEIVILSSGTPYNLFSDTTEIEETKNAFKNKKAGDIVEISNVKYYLTTDGDSSGKAKYKRIDTKATFSLTDPTVLRNLVEAGYIIFKKPDKNGKDGFSEVNIATDTSLQEVSDETELKKAEAKYEADMRKINAKDKKFDTDLAAMETERNAIKTEMDTLKSVAKDNVDRTFKLFG